MIVGRNFGRYVTHEMKSWASSNSFIYEEWIERFNFFSQLEHVKV